MTTKRKSEKRERQLETTHRRYGWTALFLWLLFGLVLETMQGFKVSGYLLEPIRREMWSLAHFHGVTLSLVNLIYIRWAESPYHNAEQRLWASRTLVAGSILMPAGFFLGGLTPFEGDPGLGIFGAPIGALLVLFTAALQVTAVWRNTP